MQVKDADYRRALLEMRKKKPNLGALAKSFRRSAARGNPEAIYALAGWHLHGMPPFAKKDIREGVRLLRKAVAGRVPDAMYDLAISYETGQGVKENALRAYKLYLAAALRGESQSVFEVGRCLFWGIGVERNRALAKIWLDRAKEIGTYEVMKRSKGNGRKA